MRRFGAILALALLAGGCHPKWVSTKHGGEKEKALVAAVDAGDAVKAKALLADGVDLTALVRTPLGEKTAWEFALNELDSPSRRGPALEIVLAMLKAGADPNASWSHAGESSLHSTSMTRTHAMDLAAAAGSVQTIRAMLGQGLDLKGRGASLALLSAVDGGHVEVVRLLLDAGVDPNSGKGDETPLACAVRRGDAEVIRLLEAKGAREWAGR